MGTWGLAGLLLTTGTLAVGRVGIKSHLDSTGLGRHRAVFLRLITSGNGASTKLCHKECKILAASQAFPLALDFPSPLPPSTSPCCCCLFLRIESMSDSGCCQILVLSNLVSWRDAASQPRRVSGNFLYEIKAQIVKEN